MGESVYCKYIGFRIINTSLGNGFTHFYQKYFEPLRTPAAKAMRILQGPFSNGIYFSRPICVGDFDVF